jgi:tetratricopeptide (TPR) repeat protein
MLVGPFSLAFVLLILAAGGFRLLGNDGRFLVWAGAPWFLFTAVFHHTIGPARQWDLFAPAALIWVVLAALLLTRLPGLAGRPARAGILTGLVLGTSLFHTLAWVGVGTDADRSLRHFAALFGPGSPAAPAARSYAFDGMGTYYLSRSEVENAEMAYREAVTADTTNAEAAGHLGSLYVFLGRKREAVGILNWAVRYAPDREYLHYELGNAYQLAGNPVSALTAYRRALELNSNFLQAYLKLAALERRTGKFAVADSLLDEAGRRFPDDTEVLAERAQLAHARGDTLDAVRLYEQTITRNPGNLDAVFNLGNLFYHLGRYQEAAGCFETVTRRSSKDAEAWLNLASCREAMEQSRPALEALEQALYLAPDRPDVYFGIFRNRMAAGDTAQAVLALRAFANRDSTSRMGRTAVQILGALEAGTPPPRP